MLRKNFEKEGKAMLDPNTFPREIPVIEGDSIRLRPFMVSDVDSLQKSLSNPNVTQRLSKIGEVYTRDDAAAWIKQEATLITMKSQRISFVVEVDGKLVGSVSFINLDLLLGDGQLSTWVAEDFWGRGVAHRALQLLITYGFEELILDRIFAYHIENNFKTKGLMEKIGMPLEGIKPNSWCIIKDGKRVRSDTYQYDLFRWDWKERSN